MSKWSKSPQKKAPPYLEVKEGRHGPVYRCNYRREGIAIREVIPLGLGEDWIIAARRAERLVAEARFGKKEKPKSRVRCGEIIEQLLKEAETQRSKTLSEKQQSFKHLGPWLDENVPYASDLTVETWPKYKAFKRAERPEFALENHVKRFRMLRKRAFELGIIPQLFPVKFDVKKEEFRQEGMLIAREHEALILAACTQVWRARSIIQRDTGLRPGECRGLRKSEDSVGNPASLVFDGENILVRVYPQDNKNNRYREFWIYSARAREAIREQADRTKRLDSPFLFPMTSDHARPMDPHLGGWRGALKRAFDPEGKGAEAPGYTPHDWRHTYATEMFKITTDWAQLCYQLDMSLETANGSYLHLKASDTEGVARAAAQSAAEFQATHGGRNDLQQN